MQHLIADTLDDLLRKVYSKILRHGQRVKASKGRNKELSCVVLELRNPRARLSRTEIKGTVFSCLGETLWYLARSDELDSSSITSGRTVNLLNRMVPFMVPMGPRLFGMRGGINQIDNVIKLLRRKPSSRQAVVQLFNAEDLLDDYNDIPCTCTIQYFVRKDRLHSVVHMRSNDAFIGLPHDVFAFTFMQEVIARSLGLRLGSYKHMVGSLHIYDADKGKVVSYIRERYQARIPMPRMPTGESWPHLKKLIKVEALIREGRQVRLDRYCTPNYWADLMRLLQIFALNKRRRSTRAVQSQMSSSVYDSYITKAVAKTN
jgi:thymidylate synthase